MLKVAASWEASDPVAVTIFSMGRVSTATTRTERTLLVAADGCGAFDFEHDRATAGSRAAATRARIQR
jgi:hypothetical protein